MKVTGPNAGPPSAPEVGPAGESNTVPAATDKTEGSGRAFADKLEKLAVPAHASGGHPVASATQSATLTGGPGAAPGIATGDLAADVRAGNLPPRAAVEKVIEQVLERQLGADAPPAMRERVRAALQEALESDPLLAEKLQRLG